MIKKNYIQTVYPNGVSYSMDSRGHVSKRIEHLGCATQTPLGCAFGDPNYSDCEFEDWYCSMI